MVRPVLQPYFYMLCGSLWFSWMGILTHALKDSVDWQIAALARSGLATVFAIMLALATRSPLVFPGPRILWIRSIAGSCSMVSTFYALTHMPVSDVLTITNTFPMWVALLVWPLLGERPTWGVWLAVGCAVLGVAVAQQPHVHGVSLAGFSALAASIFTAIAMIGLNRLQGVPSVAIVVHFSAVSTVFCAAAFFLFERGNSNSHLGDWDVIARLAGVGATATIGQVFLTRAFRAGSATKVSVVGLSQVVMVMVLEAILDGRTFPPSAVLGTILVLGPTAWVMLHERRVVDDVPME
jgi:drug/metabolite transporter (DMT)-like permease